MVLVLALRIALVRLLLAQDLKLAVVELAVNA
jgi:hypothetical protein